MEDLWRVQSERQTKEIQEPELSVQRCREPDKDKVDEDKKKSHMQELLEEIKK
jgi:hypothetical protein